MNGRIENLILSIICFLVILPFVLMLSGCGLNPDLPKEKVTAVLQINLVDGYIKDCGVPLAVGCARKKSQAHYVVDISNKSGGQTATLEHELKHVYRWLYGWEPNWVGH